MIKRMEGEIRPHPPKKKLKLSKNDIKFMKNQVEGSLPGI